MRLGIDASNLRIGGGVTHLCQLLTPDQAEKYGFTQVVVWGGQKTLKQLPTKPWLEVIHIPMLDGKLPLRLYWQKFKLPHLAKNNCDLLFVPGGISSGKFKPFVTMSQNLVPFEINEMRRYSGSWVFWKLLLLQYGQKSTFKKADGMIFLTNYARKVVENSGVKCQGLVATIPHGVNPKFWLEPRPQKKISEYSLEKPFCLLYVSSIENYKHQCQVAEAVAQLRQEGMPIKLVLAGLLILQS